MEISGDADTSSLLQVSTQMPHHPARFASATQEAASILTREFHILPHHKSGVMMGKHAVHWMKLELMNKSGQDQPLTFENEAHYMEAASNGTIPLVECSYGSMGFEVDASAIHTPSPACLAHFARNPFEMVVSGMEYHKALSEPWLKGTFAQAKIADVRGCEHLRIDARKQNMCADGSMHFSTYRLLQGVAQVFRSSISGRFAALLPDAQPSETYPEYLQRVDLNESLIAEFVLASGTTLEPMASAHTLVESRHCSLETCMSDFFDNCNATWERIMNTWGIKEPHRSVMFNAAEMACPGVDPSSKTHSSDNNLKRRNMSHVPEYKMTAYLRDLDRLYLNGKLAALEASVGCPVSGKYAHATTK